MKFVRELLYGATKNSMTMDFVHLERNDAEEHDLHIKRSFYSYRAKLRIKTCQNSFATKTKLNSVALVRERTIPTERPPPVGEVSANFCGEGCHVVSATGPHGR